MEQCCADIDLGEFPIYLCQKKEQLGTEDGSKAFLSPHLPIRQRLPY
jgi:hypothetical protein